MTIHQLHTDTANNDANASANEDARASASASASTRAASGTDQGGWASITACPDGPLLVRGDVDILLADGSPAPRRRRTVALCRCGASGIKPYCDGSHKVVGFRTDDEPTTTCAAPPPEQNCT